MPLLREVRPLWAPSKRVRPRFAPHARRRKLAPWPIVCSTTPVPVLRSARERAGATQREVAQRAGASTATISRPRERRRAFRPIRFRRNPRRLASSPACLGWSCSSVLRPLGRRMSTARSRSFRPPAERGLVKALPAACDAAADDVEECRRSSGAPPPRSPAPARRSAARSTPARAVRPQAPAPSRAVDSTVAAGRLPSLGPSVILKTPKVESGPAPSRAGAVGVRIHSSCSIAERERLHKSPRRIGRRAPRRLPDPLVWPRLNFSVRTGSIVSSTATTTIADHVVLRRAHAPRDRVTAARPVAGDRPPPGPSPGRRVRSERKPWRWLPMSTVRRRPPR